MNELDLHRALEVEAAGIEPSAGALRDIKAHGARRRHRQALLLGVAAAVAIVGVALAVTSLAGGAGSSGRLSIGGSVPTPASAPTGVSQPTTTSPPVVATEPSFTTPSLPVAPQIAAGRVYVAYDWALSRIVAVNATNGATVGILATGVANISDLSAAADGSAIAYVTGGTAGGSCSRTVWTVSTSPGSTPDPVVSGTIADAALSPDGHEIAYLAQQVDCAGGSDLAVRDLQTGTTETIGAAPTFHASSGGAVGTRGAGGAVLTRPVWDGAKLIVGESAAAGLATSLHAVDPANPTVTVEASPRLPVPASAQPPVVVGVAGGDLVAVVNSPTTPTAQVVVLLDATTGATLRTITSGIFDVATVAVDPTGTKLAVVVGIATGSPTKGAVQILSIAGGAPVTRGNSIGAVAW